MTIFNDYGKIEGKKSMFLPAITQEKILCLSYYHLYLLFHKNREQEGRIVSTQKLGTRCGR
jgi:hypothetical protein